MLKTQVPFEQHAYEMIVHKCYDPKNDVLRSVVRTINLFIETHLKNKRKFRIPNTKIYTCTFQGPFIQLGNAKR